MTANYGCPQCDGRLGDGGAANVWRCRTCGQLVVEAISSRSRRVREFYRRATGRYWGGLR